MRLLCRVTACANRARMPWSERDKLREFSDFSQGKSNAQGQFIVEESPRRRGRY